MSMTLYGLKSFYHHRWSRVLTVISSTGNSNIVSHIKTGDGIALVHTSDGLARYLEQKKGALDEFINNNAIEVLDSARWTAQKAQIENSSHD